MVVLIAAEHRKHFELIGTATADVSSLSHELVDDPLLSPKLDAERPAFV